jgi:hypothetical protein
MPKFENHEEPADLFIHIVRTVQSTEDSFIADRIQASCGRLLDRECQSETFRDPFALGELMYMAARIDAASAITPVSKIFAHAQAHTLLANREAIRTRALRVLLGLLASHRDKADAFHQDVLRKALEDSACVSLAVTGLIGLFGEDRERLISELQGSGMQVNEAEIDLNLRITGIAA